MTLTACPIGYYQKIMLRYLAHGLRDFVNDPVPPCPRLNWEFYAVTQGKCAPVIPGHKPLPLRSNVLWLCAPNLLYGWRGEKPCYRYAFHFATVVPEVKEVLRDNSLYAVDLSRDEILRIKQLANDLEPHFKSPHGLSHLHFEYASMTLSLIILKNEKPKKDIPLHLIAEERVQRVLSWYSINMARNPTVDEVAEAINMTASNLRRMTQKARKTTPHKLFRELQIKRATNLLANTPATLQEVAKQCGFNYVEDFYRVFRQEVGTSPDGWRRHVLKTDRPDL